MPSRFTITRDGFAALVRGESVELHDPAGARCYITLEDLPIGTMQHLILRAANVAKKAPEKETCRPEIVPKSASEIIAERAKKKTFGYTEASDIASRQATAAQEEQDRQASGRPVETSAQTSAQNIDLDEPHQEATARDIQERQIKANARGFKGHPARQVGKTEAARRRGQKRYAEEGYQEETRGQEEAGEAEAPQPD